MTTLLLGEIFEQISNAKNKKERIELLKSNDSLYLRQALRLALDETLQFDLPEGEPPYKKSDLPPGNQQAQIRQDLRKYYQFLKGSNLQSTKKERNYIDFLEGYAECDVKLAFQIKDKKIKNVTLKLVLEVFPDIMKTDLNFPGQQKPEPTYTRPF